LFLFSLYIIYYILKKKLLLKMVDYYCVECGKQVAGVLIERKIRCPFCSAKAVQKKQTGVSNTIKSR